MSGWHSKKLMSNDRQGTGIDITGMTREQFEILDAMWGFDTEEELNEWQDSLTLRQSQIVDSLLIIILLEHFDRIIDIVPDYEIANQYLNKFRIH